jgi:hypothetical protein
LPTRKKCSFAQEEVEYLGHLIFGRGVTANPKKIEDMLKWPILKDLKGLRGFLGLIGYYRKFVKDYGKKALAFNSIVEEGWIPLEC